MIKSTSLADHSGFTEICRALDISDTAITQIQTVKRLQTLDSALEKDSLIYVESKEAIKALEIHQSVSVLVKDKVPSDYQIAAITVKNPSFVFWSLYEFIERSKNFVSPSIISNKSIIGNNTSISKQGVVIEDDVTVDDNVVIKPGVIIRKGAKIGPGSVIGSNGLEVKQTLFGRIVISHKGGVVISENVEIGALCTINQGLGDKATQICADTKIDSSVHIAHSCLIGKRNTIAANVTFGGNVVTGSDVFFGLNSTIKNSIKIGNNVFVGMAAVVVKDVEVGVVAGNPARVLRANQ